MKKITAKIEVEFKNGVLDPQGETIKNALLNLDYNEVRSVKTGKLFWVELESDSAAKAKECKVKIENLKLQVAELNIQIEALRAQSKD